MLKILPFLLILFFLGENPNNQDDTESKYDLKWVWEDDFSEAEKQLVKEWIAEVNTAVRNTLGVYQFDMHVHIHRSENNSEPSPEANTWRFPHQIIHFHISTEFSKEEFLKDWTAQHEISHLSLPYIGEKERWFSEGYASFMQYQIMVTQGIYTKKEIAKKYKAKFLTCSNSFESDLPFPEMAKELKEQGESPNNYWGGCYFFWLLDQELQERHQMTLADVIKKYVVCCRKNFSKPKDVVKAWDSIIGGTTCSGFYTRFTENPANEFH